MVQQKKSAHWQLLLKHFFLWSLFVCYYLAAFVVQKAGILRLIELGFSCDRS
jgi:hypothetical protein